MTHPILDNWTEISHHRPPSLFQPQCERELQQFLQADSLPCLLAGNGSKYWMGNPVLPVETCLDLRRFDCVLEYSPGDLTITVQAGMPFSKLQATLAAQLQTLPVDPPLARSSTVGGMVAVGLSGPLQQACGTLRDKVLGVKVIHPDGTITRAGGKVVKNVAGYDLCKLYCGSFGTLVALLEITFRVFPLADSTRCFIIEVNDLDQACESWRKIRKLPVNSAGIIYVEEPAQPRQLIVRLRGTARSVEEQLAEVRAAFPAGQTRTDDMVEKITDRFYSSSLPLWLRMETLPGSFLKTVPLLQKMQQQTLMVDFGSRRCHFSTGHASIETVKQVRDNLHKAGAALVIEKAPLPFKQQIDAWGSKRVDLFLSNEIRLALDPGRRFNPGRYVTGA